MSSKIKYLAILFGAVSLFLTAFPASVAQSTGPLHLGILVSGSPGQRTHLEQALLDGLREQGYIEGKNLILERRYANGESGPRMPENARELAKMKLDAVITTCTPSTRAAMQAIPSTPIVMSAVADPVGQHLIASLARPGGNVTGLASEAEDILPKMLQLFSSVLPKGTIVAVLLEARSEVHPRMWQRLVSDAQALKLKLVRVDVQYPAELNLSAAFEMAMRQKAGAIFVLPDEPMFYNRRAYIVELAAKYRLPAFYGAREFVEEGGLMSYGENMSVAYRNTASYIGKVARGTRPAELPVQQPTKFELAVNLKTAKALGVTIPQVVLLQADKVIE